MTRSSTGVLVVLLLAVVIFVTCCALFWPLTIDDSFITLRYARSLAEGNGPNYNVGERAEGYTSILWVLILTVPHLLHIDAVVFSKVVGVAAVLGLFAIMVHFTRCLSARTEVGSASWAGASAALWLASYPPTAIHAVSGMETMLFAVLFLAFLYALTLVVVAPNAKHAATSAVLALLMSLTRPEGALVAAIGLATTLLLLPGPDRATLVRRTALLYLVPGCAYFAWRWRYYGHLFPLPFYVKVSSPHSLAGLHDTLAFVKSIGSRVGLLAVGVLVRPHKRLLPALACSGVFGLFFVVPSHLMGYEYRFLYPLVPVTCVLAAVGLGTLHLWMTQAGRPRMPLARAGIVAAVVMALTLRMAAGLPGSRAKWQGYVAGMNSAHLALARALARTATRGASPVLALGDAGAVPYYSAWRTIDTFGLNDPAIATTNSHAASYILAQKPDVVALLSSDERQFKAKLPWEDELYRACLREGLTPLRVLWFASGHYLWVLARPDTPWAQDIRHIAAEPGAAGNKASVSVER